MTFHLPVLPLPPGTPELGSTLGEYSVFDLPLRLNLGHTLTVTVMPAAPGEPSQVFERDFRTGELYLLLITCYHSNTIVSHIIIW